MILQLTGKGRHCAWWANVMVVVMVELNLDEQNPSKGVKELRYYWPRLVSN